jgi:predicted phage baseplate assembly protein
VPDDRVVDGTRALTLDGAIEIRLPASLRKTRVGRVAEELYYLRCRVVSGVYDEVPWVRDVSLNGVAAEQAYRAGFLSWQIAADAVVEGTPPAPGDRASFRIRLNAGSQVTHVSFGGSNLPRLHVLEYRPPATGAPGVLAVAADRVGAGSGERRQEYRLPMAPVVSSGFRLLTLEEGAWTEWSARVDLDASRAADSHFVLDAQRGVVSFGDGRNGRVPPPHTLIVAAGDVTRGASGNLDRDRVNRFPDSPQNRVVAAAASLGTAQEVADRFAGIRNTVPAVGGADAETLADAEARALDLAGRGQQAVTAADYERLARAVPGTRVARAFARPNLHPAFPCITAPGLVTVMIVPHLPRRRPVPSEGLRRAVAADLSRRRVIGTRVEVVGPGYAEITIRASIQPLANAHAGDLEARIVAALDTFLDPLTGGPDGTGWPFGRDVYRSEILHVLDRTPGVDYVTNLEIIRDGEVSQCGNVCLAPDELTTPGTHSIDIAGGGACLPRDHSN